MLIKYVLLAVVVAASGALGAAYAAGVRDRGRALAEALAGAKRLRDALIYEKRSLPAALTATGSRLFYEMGRLLKRSPSMAVHTACDLAIVRFGGPLSEQDAHAVRRLMGALAAAADTAQVSEAMGAFLSSAGETLTDVQTAQTGKASLIAKTSVLAGLAIAIILV